MHYLRSLLERLCWALLGVFGLMSPGALAWNESGHRAIAAAAARQMSPELRAQVVRVLKAHPRYTQDLGAFRPSTLKKLSEAQWLMGQAAQWPDHARSFDNAPRRKRDSLVNSYHHGSWHYINLPVYLSNADRALKIKDPTQPVRAVREWRSTAPKDVLEALSFLQTMLHEKTTTDQEKGLWVSWVLHLIADVHQPLHTAALFSKERWLRGDRGGNEVKLAGSGRGRGKKRRLDSLHYFWDSAISNRTQPGEVFMLSEVINRQNIAQPGNNEGEPLAWIREGQMLADQDVYAPLRAQLVNSPVIKLTGEYSKRAHAVSLQRAALAARRTALWLDRAFETSPKK